MKLEILIEQTWVPCRVVERRGKWFALLQLVGARTVKVRLREGVALRRSDGQPITLAA